MFLLPQKCIEILEAKGRKQGEEESGQITARLTMRARQTSWAFANPADTVRGGHGPQPCGRRSKHVRVGSFGTGAGKWNGATASLPFRPGSSHCPFLSYYWAVTEHHAATVVTLRCVRSSCLSALHTARFLHAMPGNLVLGFPGIGGTSWASVSPCSDVKKASPGRRWDWKCRGYPWSRARS